MFMKFMREVGWKLLVLFAITLSIIVVDTVMELNKAQDKKIMQLENKVIQQDIEIDDLKQTNDQLNGDLDLAGETIEQLRNEIGE